MSTTLINPTGKNSRTGVKKTAAAALGGIGLAGVMNVLHEEDNNTNNASSTTDNNTNDASSTTDNNTNDASSTTDNNTNDASSTTDNNNASNHSSDGQMNQEKPQDATGSQTVNSSDHSQDPANEPAASTTEQPQVNQPSTSSTNSSTKPSPNIETSERKQNSETSNPEQHQTQEEQHVNPDEVADAIIAETKIDPKDIDEADILEIGNTYNIIGDNRLYADCIDKDGEVYTLVDVDSDNVFDIMINNEGTVISYEDEQGNLKPIEPKITADDIEINNTDETTYIAANEESDHIQHIDIPSMDDDITTC